MTRAPDRIANVIRDAGGRIVGRTRLQKICFLLESAGLGDGFEFEYRHYGPYSEDVTASAAIARALGMIVQQDISTAWGGFYSDYSVQNAAPDLHIPESRRRLAALGANADSVQLELAATALFLALEGHPTPWEETANRKPEKAEGRLAAAKALYGQIRQIQTPTQLPEINA